MEIKQIERISINYPVGNYFMGNFDLINELYDNFIKEVIDVIAAQKYIYLVARGSSGAIMSTIFASRLHISYPSTDVTIVYTDKEEESSHSDHNENTKNIQDGIVIYVDDFISSGSSIKHAIRRLRRITGIETLQFDYVVVGRTTDEYSIQFLTEQKIVKTFVGHIYVPDPKTKVETYNPDEGDEELLDGILGDEVYEIPPREKEKLKEDRVWDYPVSESDAFVNRISKSTLATPQGKNYVEWTIRKSKIT